MKAGPARTDEVDRPAPGGWIFPALLAAVLLVSTVIALKSRPPGASPLEGPTSGWTPTPPPQGETVGLEIDFGNGARKVFAALPWREGLTVADLMGEARKFRPGIEFTHEGEGASGFLNTIDGLENQGSSGRNWRYKVDGKNGEVSFALEQLSPGMRVLWEFSEEQ